MPTEPNPVIKVSRIERTVYLLLALGMPDTTFLLLSAGVALLFLTSINKAFIRHELDAIPIVGHSGLLSYWTALQVIFTGGGPALIQQGYQQYPEGCFRIARLGHWLVIVSGPKHVKEFGDAPEHVLSFRGGIENTLAGWLCYGSWGAWTVFNLRVQ